MTRNLLQQTLYEINKKIKIPEHKIIENEDSFIIIWNTPELYFYSKAHCDNITENNYTFFKENYPFPTLEIACNHRYPLESIHPDLIFNGTSDIMFLERAKPFKENDRFEIRPVENEEDTKTFAQIICEVYNHPGKVDALATSHTRDLTLNHYHRYIGYDNKNAAGTIECFEGKKTVYIAGVSVRKEFRKKGLCRAMLAYALNREIERNFHKFVLVTSPEAKSIYTSFGFKDFALRYNYTLEYKK